MQNSQAARQPTYDGLARHAEEQRGLDRVPEPELPAGRHQHHARAVAQEDGALDGAEEDAAVRAVVHGDGVGPVVEVDGGAAAVLDLELLAGDGSCHSNTSLHYSSQLLVPYLASAPPPRPAARR